MHQQAKWLHSPRVRTGLHLPAPVGTAGHDLQSRLQWRYRHWFGAPSESGEIKADGALVRWHLYESRASKKASGAPVQFLNGLGCSCNFWHPYVARLRERRSVLLWDYPGHGLSDAPLHLERFSIEALADAAEQVWQAARIPQRIVVGHSMGVQVGLELACRHAQIVGLGACFGAPGRPLGHPDGPKARAALRVARAMQKSPKSAQFVLDRIANLPGLLEVAGGIRMVDARRMAPEDLHAYLDHIRQLDPVVFGRLLQSVIVHSRLDSLSAINVPVWVLAGDYDSLTTPDLAADIRHSVQDAQWHVLRRGTHAALVEHQDEIWRSMAPWMQHVDETL